MDFKVLCFFAFSSFKKIPLLDDMLSNGQEELYNSILSRQSIPEAVVGGKQVASRFLKELFSILFSGYHSERNFTSKDQISDQLELFRIR